MLGRRVGMHLRGLHRQIHVMAELRLVGAAATDTHARATLTTGHRSAVGQSHRGVPAVPTDHDRVGRGAVVESTRQQRGLDIAGVEPAAECGSAGSHVGHPGRESGTVRTRRCITAGNVWRAGHLCDKRHQCRESKHLINANRIKCGHPKPTFVKSCGAHHFSRNDVVNNTKFRAT